MSSLVPYAVNLNRLATRQVPLIWGSRKPMGPNIDHTRFSQLGFTHP